ncbi:MAG: AI-2E family transporter [Spirochaetes bacterium]|nr:AI-2E family transporter [Spirochaetota bacterium]
MPENQDNNKSYFILKKNKKLLILFYTFFTIVLASIVYIYRFIFWPFLYALVIYIVLRSFYRYLLKYLKIRWASSLTVIILIIMLIIIPSLIILFTLADQAYEFYIFLQNQYRYGVFNDFINNNALIQKALSYSNVTEAEILKQLVDTLSTTSLKLFSNLTGVLTFSVKFVINVFFMLLILFFLFKDGDNLSEKFYNALPFPEDIEKKVVRRLNSVIKVLLAGNLFIMVLQGLVVGVAFTVFGLNMPLLWACITAVLSLIPVIGTTLIWMPAVIYFMVEGYYISAVIIGIWCFFGYLILENLVKPKIFGKRLNFHPLIFFFLLLGSIEAFNLPGVIIGPVLLTLFFSLWESYKILNKYKA